MDTLRDLSSTDIAGVCASVGAACGVLAYLQDLAEGKPFKLLVFISKTGLSALAGWAAGELLAYQGIPPELLFALSGVAGYMGTTLLKVAMVVVPRRLGVSKEDLK